MDCVLCFCPIVWFGSFGRVVVRFVLLCFVLLCFVLLGLVGAFFFLFFIFHALSFRALCGCLSLLLTCPKGEWRKNDV